MEVVDFVIVIVIVLMLSLMVFISQRTINDSNKEIDAIQQKYHIVIFDKQLGREIKRLNKMC